MAASGGGMFIWSKLGQNLSEMEVTTFARIKKVIWDQLLATTVFSFCVWKHHKVNTHWQEKLVFVVFLCLSFVARRGHFFSSKSLKNSSKKMRPFNFQLSGNDCGFCWPKSCLVLCSYFSVSMGDRRFLWLESGEKGNHFCWNFNMLKLKC